MEDKKKKETHNKNGDNVRSKNRENVPSKNKENVRGKNRENVQNKNSENRDVGDKDVKDTDLVHRLQHLEEKITIKHPAVSWHQFTSYSKSGLVQLLLLAAIVVYTLIGASIFYLVEGRKERLMVNDMKAVRSALIDKIGVTTSTLTDLKSPAGIDKLKENIRPMFKEWETEVKEFWKLNPRLCDGKKFHTSELAWEFWNSAFFAATIYTALGYGHIVPNTNGGRVVVIIYAIFGIPLFLTIITNNGKFLKTVITSCYAALLRIYFTGQLRKPKKRRDSENEDDESENDDTIGETHTGLEQLEEQSGAQKRMPLTLALSAFIGAIIFGAVIYYLLEHEWTFLMAFYFVYIFMSNVGLGDVLPTNEAELLFSIAYFSFGMSLGVMCIEVVREFFAEEIAFATTKIGKKIGIEIEVEGILEEGKKEGGDDDEHHHH